jgi:hypothetical protein
MSRPCSRCEGAKIVAILVAGSITLTAVPVPALGQPIEGYARAYVSIPLDNSTDGPAYGLRLNLGTRDGRASRDLGRRASRPPPVFEMRFGPGEESGDLRVGGITPAMVRDRIALDRGTALWIGAGLGLAAVMAIVVAADAICIGINATCSNDKDDDDDQDETPQ